MTTLRFLNYTQSKIELITPDGKTFNLITSEWYSSTTSTGDFTIVYNSKSYPIERKYINMLTPSPSYDIYITDNITLADPVSNSTFTRGTTAMNLVDTKAVILSLEQNIMLTNSTGEWINIGSLQRKYMFMILLIIIIAIIVIGAIIVYVYKKHKKQL